MGYFCRLKQSEDIYICLLHPIIPIMLDTFVYTVLEDCISLYLHRYTFNETLFTLFLLYIVPELFPIKITQRWSLHNGRLSWKV
jgi:hypothetical protein